LRNRWKKRDRGRGKDWNSLWSGSAASQNWPSSEGPSEAPPTTNSSIPQLNSDPIWPISKCDSSATSSSRTVSSTSQKNRKELPRQNPISHFRKRLTTFRRCGNRGARRAAPVPSALSNMEKYNASWGRPSQGRKKWKGSRDWRIDCRPVLLLGTPKKNCWKSRRRWRSLRRPCGLAINDITVGYKCSFPNISSSSLTASSGRSKPPRPKDTPRCRK
jgi:hypothetical protein